MRLPRELCHLCLRSKSLPPTSLSRSSNRTRGRGQLVPRRAVFLSLHLLSIRTSGRLSNRSSLLVEAQTAEHPPGQSSQFRPRTTPCTITMAHIRRHVQHPYPLARCLLRPRASPVSRRRPLVSGPPRPNHHPQTSLVPRPPRLRASMPTVPRLSRALTRKRRCFARTTSIWVVQSRRHDGVRFPS